MSNSEKIQNNLERMRADMNELDQKIAELKSASEEAFEQLSALDGMWSGPAHSTFVIQRTIDKMRVGAMMQALKNYRTSLQEAYDVYQSCESNVASEVGSL